MAEVVAATLDQQRVRRCLGGLTELQRESVKLAYYGGYYLSAGGDSCSGWPSAR